MINYKKIKERYIQGARFHSNPYVIEGKECTKEELNKDGSRTDVINYLLGSLKRPTNYLEIGVRNPNDNFNKILADTKYSVDPGIEFKENPVDFKVTSDVFFEGLRNDTLLEQSIQFDVIFVDGLHLAEQVMRDFENAMQFLKDDGFLVFHDCNPPTEWHARENFNFSFTPAQGYWNGTTWKAFVEIRKRTDLFSCCVDTDWGVGVVSKHVNFGASNQVVNPFFEFQTFAVNRKNSLNLLTFDQFKELLQVEY